MDHFKKILFLSLLFLIVAIKTKTKICIYIGILLVACEIVWSIINFILVRKAKNEAIKRIFDRAQDALSETLKALEQKDLTKTYPFVIQIEVKSIIEEEIKKCENFLRECEKEYADFYGLIISIDEDREECIRDELKDIKDNGLITIEWVWSEANKNPEIRYLYDTEEID